MQVLSSKTQIKRNTKCLFISINRLKLSDTIFFYKGIKRGLKELRRGK